MTISTFKIDIKDVAIELTSRPVGARARTYLLSLLDQYERIDIDFHFASLTPSFADECVGQLAASMGFDDFRARVKLINLSEAAKPLLKHVILTRCRPVVHHA
jgi:hypothetical protein